MAGRVEGTAQKRVHSADVVHGEADRLTVTVSDRVVTASRLGGTGRSEGGLVFAGVQDQGQVELVGHLGLAAQHRAG